MCVCVNVELEFACVSFSTLTQQEIVFFATFLGHGTTYWEKRIVTVLLLP